LAVFFSTQLVFEDNLAFRQNSTTLALTEKRSYKTANFNFRGEKFNG